MVSSFWLVVLIVATLTALVIYLLDWHLLAERKTTISRFCVEHKWAGVLLVLLMFVFPISLAIHLLYLGS